jgi:hypothetical protein
LIAAVPARVLERHQRYERTAIVLLSIQINADHNFEVHETTMAQFRDIVQDALSHFSISVRLNLPRLRLAST